jgi:hypothetical protein
MHRRRVSLRKKNASNKKKTITPIRPIWSPCPACHARQQVASNPTPASPFCRLVLVSTFSVFASGLPDGLVSIWENFGGPSNGNCWYIS